MVAVSAPTVAMSALPAAPVASYAPVSPDGGPRLWYEGVDALIPRELRERLSVSWGDIPQGAAVVGFARCLGEVLDHIQKALESVDAGRSNLVKICTEVTKAVDRREIADQWSAAVFATTREWPPSAGVGIPY